MSDFSNYPSLSRWTDDEVEMLVHFIEQEIPEHYLCTLLKRNASDIGQKMRELAINFADPYAGHAHCRAVSFDLLQAKECPLAGNACSL